MMKEKTETASYHYHYMTIKFGDVACAINLHAVRDDLRYSSLKFPHIRTKFIAFPTWPENKSDSTKKEQLS